MAINNAYIQDAERCAMPVYIPGENYSFYINFDSPIGDDEFPDFRLGLIYNGVLSHENIGVLQKDIISGTLYNIYCENFVFPSVQPGYYQFVIYNTVSYSNRAISNVIVCAREDYKSATSLLQYRDSSNMYGFNYNGLPNFRNKFRLMVNQIDMQYETDAQQYRNVTDRKFRNIKSYRDKVVTVEGYFFDDRFHEAFTALLEHNEVYINSGLYTRKGAYTRGNRTHSRLAKGTVEMYEENAYAIDVEFNEFLDFNASLTDSKYNVSGAVNSMGNIKFYFNRINTFIGLPLTMELHLNGVLFMVIDFLSDYEGKSFKILKFDGRELRGVFTSGIVNFTT